MRKEMSERHLTQYQKGMQKTRPASWGTSENTYERHIRLAEQEQQKFQLENLQLKHP